MAKRIEKLEDLTPDRRNANRGTARGRSMLERSLQSYGAGRSILVDKHGQAIAGNKTLEAAVEMGLKPIIVQTTGHELVVVQRTDLDLDKDKAARELAYADNRVAEVDLDFDPLRISDDLATGVDLSGLWTEQELGELLRAVAGGDDDPAGPGGGGGTEIDPDHSTESDETKLVNVKVGEVAFQATQAEAAALIARFDEYRVRVGHGQGFISEILDL